jgi:Transposase IS66 family
MLQAMGRRRGDRVGAGAGAGGLRAENERLRGEIDRLRGQVDELRRASKRQAAPFSSDEPKKDSQRSGRKSGESYGTKAHRQVPDHVDEEIAVPLPDGCPCCGGELALEREADQYQEDIVPARAYVRRFRVAVGRCRGCGRRGRGRHPLQTSDALGAAAAQVGPHAVALAAQLNKELGLPVSKVARVLAELCGLKITAGGLQRALARLAAAAAPTYEALVEGVRTSPAVAADETGWRVAGMRQWLWVFVGDGVTVYLIAAGRGYEQACMVLGSGFDGVLERDGWAPYRRFEHASHQTCVAHLLRRASELIADSRAGQARVPHAVRRLLLDALALRDAHADTLKPDRGNADVIDRRPRGRGRSGQRAPDRRRRGVAGAARPRPTRRRPRPGRHRRRGAGRPRSPRGASGRPRRPAGAAGAAAGRQPDPRPQPQAAQAPRQRVRAPAHLPRSPRGAGDELARRAGDPPRRCQPQALGRQPHLARRRHPAGADDRHPLSPPAASRPDRAAV